MKRLKAIILSLLVFFLVGCTTEETKPTMTYQEKYNYLIKEIQNAKTIEYYQLNLNSKEFDLIKTISDNKEVNNISTMISNLKLQEEQDAIGRSYIVKFYDRNHNELVNFDFYWIWKDNIEVAISLPKDERNNLLNYFEH